MLVIHNSQMVRLSVELPNGKVFLVFRQSPKQRESDKYCSKVTEARRYTEETLKKKLYLIGEIADVYSGPEGVLGEKFIFVSLDVTYFTGTKMEGFLKIFKRRYRLSHVKSLGASPFSYLMELKYKQQSAAREDIGLKTALKHFREHPPSINIRAFTL